MRKYLIAAEIVVVLSVLAFFGGWFLFRVAPYAIAMREARAKVPLPPGVDPSRMTGNDLGSMYSVDVICHNLSVAEILSFYQTYFDENGWEDSIPTDEAAGNSLVYTKGRSLLNVTTHGDLGHVELIVSYIEYEHSHEEFDALVKESATPEALRIIDRIRKTYGFLSSYRDTGSYDSLEAFPKKRDFDSLRAYQDSERRSKSPDVMLVRDATFTTAYVAPDQLLFTYLDSMGDSFMIQYVVGVWGSTVQSMSDIDDAPTLRTDFSRATAKFYGMIDPLANNIPELLLKPDDSTLFHLARLTVIDEAALENGTTCLRLQGTEYAGAEITFWIGKEDYLIRKIESVTDAPGRTTVSYSPQANIDIPESDLAFTAHTQGFSAGKFFELDQNEISAKESK